MRTSEQGLALIQQFEGFSPVLYHDAAGLPTIGYGHLVTAAERGNFPQPLDVEAGLALLQRDVVVAEAAIWRLITVPLSQNQFDALVSFTFNLGAATLQRSTLRRTLNRKQYGQVPMQLERYVFAAGRKLSGLVKRRRAEATLFQG